jgi:hypothetical protein
MANKMSIIISAVDQTTKPIDNISKKINGLSTKNVSSKIEQFGAQLNKAFESPAGSISAVSSFLSGRTLLLGGIGGAIGAVIAQTMRMESQWASSVRGMSNMSMRTGLSFPEVYKTQYAGHLAGLTDEQTNAGVEQFRQTYSNALNNRDPEALKRYQAAGISTDPSHMESVDSALTKLAAYGQQLRDQGKYGGAQNFYQGAGVGALADWLNRGPRQVTADLLEAQRYVPSEQDRQRAQDYADATARLSVSYDRLKMTIMSDIEPGLNKLMHGVQALFDGPEARQKYVDGAVKTLNPTDARGVPIAPDESTTTGRIAAGEQRIGNFIRGRGARTNAEIAGLPGTGAPGFTGLRSGAGNITPQTYAYFSGLERKYDLPSGLLDGVWAEESSRGERLRSPKGAMGHFQFMPDTARQYGLAHPDNLAESADAAARYYRDLLRANHGNLPQALAAYNWGQGNLNKFGLGKAPAETRGYIADVLASMSESGRAPIVADAPHLLQPPEAPRIYGPSPSSTRDASEPEGPKGRVEKVQIELVHKNAPRGTSVSVTGGSENVETSIKSDRLPGSLGDQYAYSPGNF